MKGVLTAIGVVIATLAFIAFLAVFSVRVGLIAYDPFYQQGFSGQMSGLITEYCTAPRQVDQEAARQQLGNLIDREPGRTSDLPTELRRKARAAQDNRREEACR